MNGNMSEKELKERIKQLGENFHRKEARNELRRIIQEYLHPPA